MKKTFINKRLLSNRQPFRTKRMRNNYTQFKRFVSTGNTSQARKYYNRLKQHVYKTGDIAPRQGENAIQFRKRQLAITENKLRQTAAMETIAQQAGLKETKYDYSNIRALADTLYIESVGDRVALGMYKAGQKIENFSLPQELKIIKLKAIKNSLQNVYPEDEFQEVYDENKDEIRKGTTKLAKWFFNEVESSQYFSVKNAVKRVVNEKYFPISEQEKTNS